MEPFFFLFLNSLQGDLNIACKSHNFVNFYVAKNVLRDT